MGGEDMERIAVPFEFKQCITLLKATGLKARNLDQLMEAIAVIGEESIFHHTYEYFLKERVFEYTNDFAHWAGESLEESTLAEQLSNIDPYEFDDLAELRQRLTTVIEGYLKLFPEAGQARPGDEFCFNETVTLVFPVGIKARNLAEFLMAVKIVDSTSLYYHFFAARTRLKGSSDDFSRWIADVFQKEELARKIRSIDPFMHNLEEIRGHVVEAVEEEVRKDMEAMEMAGEAE
jgi:hypothetical protein